jgi:hypothetical protein
VLWGIASSWTASRTISPISVARCGSVFGSSSVVVELEVVDVDHQQRQLAVILLGLQVKLDLLPQIDDHQMT